MDSAAESQQEDRRGLASTLGYWVNKASLWTPVPAATFLLWSMAAITSLLLRLCPSMEQLQQIQRQINASQQDVLTGRSLVGVRWQQLWLVYSKTLWPRRFTSSSRARGRQATSHKVEAEPAQEGIARQESSEQQQDAHSTTTEHDSDTVHARDDQEDTASVHSESSAATATTAATEEAALSSGSDGPITSNGPAKKKGQLSEKKQAGGRKKSLIPPSNDDIGQLLIHIGIRHRVIMYTTRRWLLLICLYLTGTAYTLARKHLHKHAYPFDTRLLHCLINDERERHGLAPLLSNNVLDAAAEHHSSDLARHQFLSHEGSNGSMPPERAAAAAARLGDSRPSDVSENVLYGAVDEPHAVRLWMESPGHRRNILDPDVRVSGVGFAVHDDVNYVTQMFAREGEGATLSCSSGSSDEDEASDE
ncbi:hypothetical protein SYNPS1DRAFT_27690 [Syncephalis pseudoplumigaleata]|uniref:SCP domain-containing protein n=1 Tax=Syncephalis pseudoplumigaleata TaxID=1712513 RepID=A0A4P9Z3N2_9FUNG|nr:hypothetical protein SYNPS1DRAFT_27690 [Syncephalis pseudoplumigaleata]|eukprot:RKP26632.1 hypothetical protein SYNPS1DRAFT_27690 [Syncephalis pseudoplumigaleata]